MEFLATLQTRSKWSKSRGNLTVRDIVLLKTEVNDRNHWPMARVIGQLIFRALNRAVKMK